MQDLNWFLKRFDEMLIRRVLFFVYHKGFIPHHKGLHHENRCVCLSLRMLSSGIGVSGPGCRFFGLGVS